MKLFSSPGACSLASHITLRELDIPFELVRASGHPKKMVDGTLLTTLNPKGAVPTLVLDNGEVLTEGPAILQYIADLKPSGKLAPPAGSFERLRLQEWLSFLGSDVHKTFTPLFNAKCPEEWKVAMRESMATRLSFLSERLAEKPYLMGEDFSVADAYLFVMLQWTERVKVDLQPFPALRQFQTRVGERPAVRASIEAEAAF